MKFFNSKTKSSKKSAFRNLFSEFKMCSGLKSDFNDNNNTYKSMSEPIEIPAPIATQLPQHLPQLCCGGSGRDESCGGEEAKRQLKLKSCMKKQSARSNLRTRFADAAAGVTATTTTTTTTTFVGSSWSESMTTTPEKMRAIVADNSLGRMLSSTTLDSPVVAFSNATYTGSPINESKLATKYWSPPSTKNSTTTWSPRPQTDDNDDEDDEDDDEDDDDDDDDDDEDDYHKECGSLTTSTLSSSSSTSTTIEDLHNCSVYMVCSVPYVARSVKELTLEFADRVRVLQASPDWSLVYNPLLDRYGYVPSASLISVEQFIRDVHYLTRGQFQSKKFFGYI